MISFLRGIGELILRYPLPFLTVAFLLNLVAFIFYGVDKRRAIKGKWRIAETTLLLFSVLGAGIGSWFGMKAFRHKTLHLKFTITVPLFAVLYTVFFGICLYFAICPQ